MCVSMLSCREGKAVPGGELDTSCLLPGTPHTDGPQGASAGTQASEVPAGHGTPWGPGKVGPAHGHTASGREGLGPGSGYSTVPSDGHH